MAIPAYRNGNDSSFHDWADFIIRDGVIYDYNTARAGSSPFKYKYSAYHHFNMMTGNRRLYQNPNLNNTIWRSVGYELEWNYTLSEIVLVNTMKMELIAVPVQGCCPKKFLVRPSDHLGGGWRCV
ncbi:MAG: hypothetical protein IPN39_05280 [Chitinophagaceae bacterium]|nr:hypothetical protein [Chitinophagaceae bacterium]